MGIFIFVLYAAAAVLGLFFVIILINFSVCGFGLWYPVLL